MDYYELYHHGILNQRWGVKNGPPYPLSKSVSQSIKKKKRFPGLLSSKKEGKKKENKKKMELDPEEEKRRILREGTATEVLRHIGELTNQEISEALNRIKWTNELRAISKKEFDKGWNDVNDLMKKVGNVKDWGRTGIDLMKVVKELQDLSKAGDKK